MRSHHLNLCANVQVWWYATSLMKGKLVCRDLVSGRIDEVVPGSTAATALRIPALCVDLTLCMCRSGSTQRP